jgi:predicted MPP superfamily phosphohydrolase
MHVPLTRRRFLLGSATAALGVGAYTWRVEPHWVSVVRRDMAVRNLPSEMQGRTLAQISDLHVCPKVDSDYLGACLREVSALQPDVVAVTGDFVSSASRERFEEVARVFENLAPPPLGCFAVFGNHDFGERWSDMTLAGHLEKRLTEIGVTVLRNASRDVRGLRIAGVDDLWGPNFRPAEVLPKLGAEEPAVVLCHNPDAAGGFCRGTRTAGSASRRSSRRRCSRWRTRGTRPASSTWATAARSTSTAGWATCCGCGSTCAPRSPYSR